MVFYLIIKKLGVLMDLHSFFNVLCPRGGFLPLMNEA